MILALYAAMMRATESSSRKLRRRGALNAMRIREALATATSAYFLARRVAKTGIVVRDTLYIPGLDEQLECLGSQRMVVACAVGAGCRLPTLGVAARTLEHLGAEDRRGPCRAVVGRSMECLVVGRLGWKRQCLDL